MTKKEVQEYLSSYKENDELFVMWWDKEFLAFDGGNPITNKEWEKIVAILDCYAFDTVNETMHFIMEEELTNIRNK